MGSFNVTCALTNLPIEYGEEVKLTFLVENTSKSLSASALYKLFIPTFLDATYDDYGRFEFHDENVSNEVLKFFQDECMVGTPDVINDFYTLKSFESIFDKISRNVLFTLPSQMDITYGNSYRFKDSSMSYSEATPKRVYYMAIKKSVIDSLCDRKIVLDAPVFGNSEVLYRDYKLLEFLDDFNIPNTDYGTRLKKHIVVSGIINSKQWLSSVCDECKDEINNTFKKELEKASKTDILSFYMFKMSRLDHTEILDISEDELNKVILFEQIIDKYSLDINMLCDKFLVDQLLCVRFSSIYHNPSKNNVARIAYSSVNNTKLLAAYKVYLQNYLHKYFVPSGYAGQETDTTSHRIFSEIVLDVIKKQKRDDEEF